MHWSPGISKPGNILESGLTALQSTSYICLFSFHIFCFYTHLIPSYPDVMSMLSHVVSTIFYAYIYTSHPFRHNPVWNSLSGMNPTWPQLPQPSILRSSSNRIHSRLRQRNVTILSYFFSLSSPHLNLPIGPHQYFAEQSCNVEVLVGLNQKLPFMRMSGFAASKSAAFTFANLHWRLNIWLVY